MPRLLFAMPIANLGGAELALHEMLLELRERWPEAELHVVSGADGPMLTRMSADGVICHRLPLPAVLAEMGDSSAQRPKGQRGLARLWGRMSTLVKVFGALRRYLREWRALLAEIQPDLVFSNGLKFHVMTGLGGVGRARLVWYMHDYLSSRPLISRVLPRLARRVNLVLVNSQSVAEDVALILRRTPPTVVYLGLDLDKFAPGPGAGSRLDELAGLTPLSAGGIRVGLVGTYARWKGQDLLIDAFADVLRIVPDIPLRLYIIGGPIYATAGSQFSRDELEQQVRALGLSERVGFVPFQDSVADAFRALDIVVHASRHREPFGRTVLEGMACGRPVIAVADGGSGEIFQDGVSALGIPLNDRDALARQLQRLIVDPELRNRLAQQGRQRALEFSRPRMGEQLTGLLRGQLDDAASTGMNAAVNA